MRRLIQIALLALALCPLSLRATDIVCEGTATQVVDGTDTLFVFKDEIHLKTSDGSLVDWYKADGTLYMSNASDIYPDDGCYRAAGHTFCAQVYQDIADLAISAEADCMNTIVKVTGDIASRTHAYSLSYNALTWNGEAWADSAAQTTGTLRPAIALPALYGPTTITLYYDPEIRAALGLDSAYVETQLDVEDLMAVNMQLTSLATAREDDPNGNNERNRPTSQDIIKATASTDYSGPLEVAFYSNPTPAVQFYQWAIYKSTERIVTRFDQDIRYTFSEPGAYRVVCKVNNNTCTTDSMEMAVAISESYLAVPNVFTPNGDNMNDEFRVSYRSLREFHCWVYNRWGHLVYEWSDPAKGWDGTIYGRPAAEGAYFYVIRALGTDAPKDASYTMKAAYNKKKLNADESVIGVYQLSGDINLIRGKQN